MLGVRVVESLDRVGSDGGPPVDLENSPHQLFTQESGGIRGCHPEYEGNESDYGRDTVGSVVAHDTDGDLKRSISLLRLL